MSCGRCNCNCKKAIITGVTGQDGSHLADLLLEKNYKVVGMVRRTSTDNTSRIKHLEGNKNFKLIEGDITDYSSIVNVLWNNVNGDFEFYNLAAQSHVAVSFKQPGLTWDITGKGCLNVLQAIVDTGLTDRARFYQASSSEMFGKNYDLVDGVKIQTETTRFLPQSPYAIAKCAAHEAVRLYREAYGLHASAGILFNHEGPRRGDTFVTRKITKWIGSFVQYLKRNNLQVKDLTMSSLDEESDIIFASGVQESFPKLRLGNLEAFRDWGYAGDYVEAMWRMLQQSTPDDYVVCTGETHTIREFLDAAFNFVGIKDWNYYVIQDPEFYRPAEVDYLKGDNTKAKNNLGWQPQTSFIKLVEMMLQHDL
jgi:GDPmannose 4,6-dehydratase